jgi:hypothetical protein
MEWRVLKVLAGYVPAATRQTSLLFAILMAASAGVALAAMYLGFRVDPACFWGLGLLVPLAVADAAAYRRMLAQRALDRLRNDWGKEQDRKRVFPMIESLYQYRQSSPQEDAAPLDDQTWNDLNMNDVYAKLDRTLTNPGECALYQMLRTPLLSPNELQRRNEVIRLFQSDRTIREQIQLDLQRLGRSDTNVITSLIWGQTPSPTRVRHLYSFLALLALVAAVGAPLLWGTRGIAVIIIVYLINLVATYGVRARLYLAIAAMRYQGSMILAARRIANLDRPDLADYCRRLKDAGSATSRIARRTFLLFPEGAFGSDIGTLIYAHLDVYFLMNVRIFHAVMEETNRHREELRTIYSLLGELDALQSVASYRQGLSAYVEPAFLERERQLSVKEARHPLLQNPVPNSLAIHEGGVTITGSNMAGKTTFLRTLGVNVVLAQTVCTCLASSYAAGPFRIFSLINDADNLLEGKSYYLVQAEHLLKMVQSSARAGRTLCLIDEPLAGTNSSERSAAAFEILQYLVRHNAMVVLATHDLELAQRLASTLKNYYFLGRVTDKGLEFDFRLKMGISPTRNAIDLLRYLGFPQTIVERAAQQVIGTPVNRDGNP